MNLQDEIHRLRQADADVDMASQRIQRQEDLVKELTRDGHDTSLALDLLTTMRGTLQALIDHRSVILETVQRLSAKRPEKRDGGRRI